MQEPGASVEKPSELDEFLCKIDMDPVEETYDEMKNNLTNALTYCKYLLESANLLTNTPSRAISSASVAMGDKIFKEIMRMLGEQKHLINDEKTFNDEDLTIIEQTDSEKEYKERKDVPGNDDPDYVVEQFEGRHNYISLAYKEKTVALAEAHPKWSLQTLQRRGCSLLKKKSLLKQWKEDVERRGTNIDKWKHIETEILERFKKARKCRKQVTTRMLQQWAMAAAFPFLSDGFTFSASESWITRFKQKYKIKQRKIKSASFVVPAEIT